MKVKDIMTKEVIYVSKGDDLYYILTLMEKHNITKLPVVEDGKIAGIVTDNQIAEKLGSFRSRGVPASRMHASTVMEKKFDRISPDTEIKEILKSVGEPGPTMLPVVVDDAIVGVVTKADLLPLVDSEESIEKIMRENVIAVKPEDRVIHARRLMLENNVARLPVVDEGRVVGIISDKEIAFALASIKKSFPRGKQQNQLRNLLVKDVMKTNVVTAKNNITIKEAARIMMEEEIGCIPIVDEKGKLKGIVTRTDLLHHLREELE